MQAQYIVDEEKVTHHVDDKALAQEKYSRSSSPSQNGEEAISHEQHDDDEENNDNDNNNNVRRWITPGGQAKESQYDAQSTLASVSGGRTDGGLHAWLKVCGGFLIYINIWGFTLSYGAFQTYYRSTLLASSSASSISWIGTTQAWLLIFVGVLSGPLFDLGYFRAMLLAGNFLVVLGIMMLSLSTRYWHVFLSQGVCMGLGAGLLYIPSLALVSIWFDRRRNIAMGIVMSGIAVGKDFPTSCSSFFVVVFFLETLWGWVPGITWAWGKERGGERGRWDIKTIYARRKKQKNNNKDT